MDFFWFTKCLKAIIINFSLLFYFKWIPFIRKVTKLQNMFSLSVFQSHCVVVVKLDNFFTEAPNYNCRAVLWQKSTVVYAQKCANLCTPVILVCSAAVDAHVLLRSAHLSVLSCSRAQELSMQRCYICLIRSAEMGHNNENSSQSLCSNNSVNSWSLISSGATNILKIRKLEK